MRALFESFPERNLAGLIIWVPMLPDDSAESARAQQRTIIDPRFRFWFDSDQSAARAWSAFIGYPGVTWDVYAVYDAGATWPRDAPPTPRIWMHQLDETPATSAGDRLDAGRLARSWLALLGADASGVTELARRLQAGGKAVSGGIEPPGQSTA